MVAREHRSSQIIELPCAVQAAVPLPELLDLVSSLLGNGGRGAVGTLHPFRPTPFTDNLVALFIVEEMHEAEHNPRISSSPRLPETPYEPGFLMPRRSYNSLAELEAALRVALNIIGARFI